MPHTTCQVIDSHTGGEPTRVVVSGGPELGDGPLAERRERLRREFDDFRTAVVNEPRGHDVLVGALLVPPHDPSCHAGVIFFNNVGYLGMCGHGAIGVVATLAHLGRLLLDSPSREASEPVVCRLDTPVGPVPTVLHADRRVTIANVASYRLHKQLEIDVSGWGVMHGDVAYGGNWFFLTDDHGQQLVLANRDQLTACAWSIRRALAAAGITGEAGAEIDHIELLGPPSSGAADSRNFVLCPGGVYDRSPCGTGTSAKVACLVADGKLHPGDLWRQESITGSIFEATAALDGDRIIPSITGRAFIMAETTLLFDPEEGL